MNRMSDHPSFTFGARLLALAAILGMAACGGNNSPPTDGGMDKPGGAGGKGGASGSVGTAGNGGTTGSGGNATGGTTGVGGSSGSTGTGGASGAGGTNDAGSDAADGPTDAAANGSACTTATDCTSNNCVDGVCCESACTGSCMACSHAKTTQNDGLCRPIPAGTDPDNECPQQAPSTCGTDGMCSGTGSCRKWAAGITCAAETCSGSTDTPARVCDGAGACASATNVSCGAYLCDATTCKTSCTSDADCISGDFCMANVCMGKKGLGAACTTGDDCSSSNCVDGVCCESACTSTCAACSNAKTSQGDGFCRPIVAGTDPDNECAQDTQASCGLDGMCDGAGACRHWSGTTCASESCTGATYTPARTCNGSGTCQTVTTTTCGAYVCGTTACKTTCASSADCATGNFCMGTQCVSVKVNGAACGGSGECASGFCVDGVCCESACGGTCAACSGAKTGLADGLCRSITAGTDPDNECPADPASTCGLDGTCDGAGACRRWLPGTTCAPESCSVATYTPPSTCDGAGTCNAASTASCLQYVCGPTACLTSCASNTDCTAGYFCSAGTCVPQETNGTACGGPGDCTSGYCVDGVCCDSACTGTCQTCSATNSLGTCKFADPGTNPRNDCTASAASTCGPDGFCDGAGACRKWAAATVCQAASCSSATIHAASTCDGAGTCNAGATTSCGAYQCSGLTCGTSCTTDAACTSFCAAGVCYASAPNLAGNGDLEYGTPTAWTTNGGGTLALQNAGTVPANVHAGTYAIADTVRSANYQGPGYNLPTGAGKYNISLWAMQNDNVMQGAAVQVAMKCGPAATQHFPVIGTYNFNLPQGVWTKVTGTVDLYAQGAECQPDNATPGLVQSALLYLNQAGAAQTVAWPNLFIDDVVVTATDGHNLVGNPNFEAGVTNGWQNNGGGTLGVSTTIFLGGSHSLALTARTSTFNGPRWSMPIGPAKYNVTFNVLHDGAMNHDLSLEGTYTCAGGSAQFPAPFVGVSQVGGNSWNTLTGTVTFPPANAAAGCKLTAAAIYVQQEFANGGSCSGIECPDIFVDDVSITLAP